MAEVFIADDSGVHVQLLTGWLQDLGLEVVATFDPIQAWVTAICTQPNTMILAGAELPEREARPDSRTR